MQAIWLVKKLLHVHTMEITLGFLYQQTMFLAIHLRKIDSNSICAIWQSFSFRLYKPTFTRTWGVEFWSMLYTVIYRYRSLENVVFCSNSVLHRVGIWPWSLSLRNFKLTKNGYWSESVSDSYRTSPQSVHPKFASSLLINFCNLSKERALSECIITIRYNIK